MEVFPCTVPMNEIALCTSGSIDCLSLAPAPITAPDVTDNATIERKTEHWMMTHEKVYMTHAQEQNVVWRTIQIIPNATECIYKTRNGTGRKLQKYRKHKGAATQKKELQKHTSQNRKRKNATHHRIKNNERRQHPIWAAKNATVHSGTELAATERRAEEHTVTAATAKGSIAKTNLRRNKHKKYA